MNVEGLPADVEGLRAGFVADLEVVGNCTEAKLIELDCALQGAPRHRSQPATQSPSGLPDRRSSNGTCSSRTASVPARRPPKRATLHRTLSTTRAVHREAQ